MIKKKRKRPCLPSFTFKIGEILKPVAGLEPVNSCFSVTYIHDAEQHDIKMGSVEIFVKPVSSRDLTNAPTEKRTGQENFGTRSVETEKPNQEDDIG